MRRFTDSLKRVTAEQKQKNEAAREILSQSLALLNFLNDYGVVGAIPAAEMQSLEAAIMALKTSSSKFADAHSEVLQKFKNHIQLVYNHQLASFTDNKDISAFKAAIVPFEKMELTDFADKKDLIILAVIRKELTKKIENLMEIINALGLTVANLEQLLKAIKRLSVNNNYVIKELQKFNEIFNYVITTVFTATAFPVTRKYYAQYHSLPSSSEVKAEYENSKQKAESTRHKTTTLALSKNNQLPSGYAASIEGYMPLKDALAQALIDALADNTKDAKYVERILLQAEMQYLRDQHVPKENPVKNCYLLAKSLNMVIHLYIPTPHEKKVLFSEVTINPNQLNTKTATTLYLVKDREKYLALTKTFGLFDLPRDLLNTVLSFLDNQSIGRLARTCRDAGFFKKISHYTFISPNIVTLENSNMRELLLRIQNKNMTLINTLPAGSAKKIHIYSNHAHQLTVTNLLKKNSAGNLKFPFKVITDKNTNTENSLFISVYSENTSDTSKRPLPATPNTAFISIFDANDVMPNTASLIPELDRINAYNRDKDSIHVIVFNKKSNNADSTAKCELLQQYTAKLGCPFFVMIDNNIKHLQEALDATCALVIKDSIKTLTTETIQLNFLEPANEATKIQELK